ncbi:MAG: RsmE family RNA methyltransferase [Polyangiales bacterium]
MRLPAQAGGLVTLRRLYVPALPDAGGTVTLTEAPLRHVRVLRLRAGDQVELFDGKGRAARARIETVGDELVCQADMPTVSNARPTRIVLMLGIPKGSKLDDCVRMATELNVDEVALMDTERSVPRWGRDRARSRVDRLTRIASEAAAQCERNDVPMVHGPQPCSAWFSKVPKDATRILFGARAEGRLRLDGKPEQVWCAVGPEGGFTESEMESFQAAGFSVASLGNSILRVETAVAAALTIVRDRLEAC